MFIEFLLNLMIASLWLIPALVIGLAAYGCLSVPMRRAERARFFLDIIEQGINSGHTPERTIVDLSSRRRASVGVHFHLLAAYIESGLRFEEALLKTPKLLPPQIVSMLNAGSATGDIKVLLPACKTLLRDPVSSTRAATNYVLMFSFTMSLSAAGILSVLAIYVIPKFELILQDMGGTPPAFCFWVMNNMGLMAQILLWMAVASYLLLFAYVSGGFLMRWTRWRQFPLVDLVLDSLPWRRKRTLRSFGQVLGILLDANVPEPRAVALATGTATNFIFERRAGRVLEALQNGANLPAALGRLDPSGEFTWRLRNASTTQGRFRASLNGWIEALEATAFRQHQAAAQILTTAMVLLIGLFVGATAVAIFQALISVVDEGVLW